jgi:endonuclease YncB( thermonuclease family)
VFTGQRLTQVNFSVGCSLVQRVALAWLFLGGLIVASVLSWESPAVSQAADRDCSDFSSQASAQEFFVAEGGPGSDPHRLDADNDGIACESNPCPCSSAAGGPSTPPVVPPPEPEPTPVRQGVVLERVVDGDTVEVRFPDNSVAPVRLIGIDTPEKYGATECGADEASAAMERRVQPGQRLRLISDGTQDGVDYYGRLLRYVELLGSHRDLGEAQLQSGWGKVYVFDADFRRLNRYRRAQRQARKRVRGVWARCGGRNHLPTARPLAAHLYASFHGCGDVPASNSYEIEAKRVSCGQAKSVVRAYNAAVNGGGGFTQDVSGFHCKVVGLYGDGGEQRCAARGHRVITFLRGG